MGVPQEQRRSGNAIMQLGVSVSSDADAEEIPQQDLDRRARMNAVNALADPKTFPTD